MASTETVVTAGLSRAPDLVEWLGRRFDHDPQSAILCALQAACIITVATKGRHASRTDLIRLFDRMLQTHAEAVHGGG